MYYFYIDESGVEGLSGNQSTRNMDDDWFSSGGIIVHEEDIRKFDEKYEDIKEEFFIKKGIDVPQNFKLHYRELRQEQPPYNELTRPEIGQLANSVFNAIKSIECKVVSASINKKNHLSKPYPYTANVRSYSLLLCLERFQYFLEDMNDEGIGIYERYTKSMRKKMTKDMKNLREDTNFRFFTNLDKVKGKIRYGEPFEEKVLQFSDFFIYAPHIRLVTNCRLDNRFEEIRSEYY